MLNNIYSDRKNKKFFVYFKNNRDVLQEKKNIQ